MDEQAQSSFNEDWEYVVYYRFTGLTGSTQPPVYNEGAGELKLYTGMVGTHHRPSDDLSTFGQFQPTSVALNLLMICS